MDELLAKLKATWKRGPLAVIGVLLMTVIALVGAALIDRIIDRAVVNPVDEAATRRAEPIRTELAASRNDLCDFGEIRHAMRLAGALLHIDVPEAFAAQDVHLCLGEGVLSPTGSPGFTARELFATLVARYPQCFRFQEDDMRRKADGSLATGGKADRLTIRTDAAAGQGALCGLPLSKDGSDLVVNEGSTWILCLMPGVGHPTERRGLVPACRLQDLERHKIRIPDPLVADLIKLLPK